ncbi:MAG: hypothetical protein HY588_02485 [Candidatus Omnitrophica bacterium]|nr:hypothetical protein [Candidatus Omnitrophota bacterium]
MIHHDSGARRSAIFTKFSFPFLFYFPLLSLAIVMGFSGCNSATYPEDKVAASIQEICRKEYKIENVEVQFAGKTIGVFLPLKKLFTANVKEEILSGNINNLDSLFEPEPEAMDQLENVLFTISRVLLSSDRPIDFYELQATDVESTGLQLVLMGYVPDVRRVRLWDISRTEYRKRVLHELKFNRSILWEKPVRQLFENASLLDGKELSERYLAVPFSPETLPPLLYQFLTTIQDKQNVNVELNMIKSRPYRGQQALVYVKLTETYEPKPGVSSSAFSYPSGTTLEYIFVVEPSGQQFKIAQVVPFYYVDDTKQLRKIPLPPELNLAQDLETWPRQFQVEEIKLGDFLARQLNRRVQALLLGDERIRHTVRRAQINFVHRDEPADASVSAQDGPSFALYFDFITKQMQNPSRSSMTKVISDEDVLYLFNLVLREFTDLLRSYQFQDDHDLELVWQPGGESQMLRLIPERLSLFQKKKIDIAVLLGAQSGNTF